MTKIALRGLVWGHRRAVGPIEPLTRAFQAAHPDIEIEWSVRPLSDFEHQGLEELASLYDLIIYDHPFSGSIVETGAFAPLSPDLGLPIGVNDADKWIGPSLSSYRFGGTVWGLPIDGATMHAAYRADLLQTAGFDVPTNWQDTITLGKALRKHGLYLGIAATAPHAALTIAALMANMGVPWSTDPDQPFSVDRDGFLTGYAMLAELVALCPPEVLEWNAIDLHDAMVARNDMAYTPCVYGYGTYGEADHENRLSFADFAGAQAPYHAGSVIGGAGIGLSRASENREAAVGFLRFVATNDAQTGLIPSRHGQAARVDAWHDPETDARFNGFFSSTRRSLETAWVRPRTRGYIQFQNGAGEAVTKALTSSAGGGAAWAQIEPLLTLVNT